MGVQICAYDSEFNELPESEWDFIRRGHDREFTGIVNDVVEPGFGDYFRPSNPNDLRKEMIKLGWEDYERYDKLLKICENGGWIEFNY